jgi:diaminopimelate decarboxylase
METLMRPALYGAFHRVQKIGKESNSTSVYDITGRICENTDRISENYTLPKIEEGDLCAIMDTGAYGYSMSHNFNTRPRPAEILINNKNIKLIRKRESIEDLFRGCNV